MPSHAYLLWDHERARELDQFEAAHAAVGGTGPGRRHAIEQINGAYAVMLAAQFQGFCRDLHTEAVAHLVTIILDAGFQAAVRQDLLRFRQLDRGNANQTTIGGDFGRLGMADFWGDVDAVSPRNARRREALDRLNEWRNAVAHQDFDPARLGGTTLRLAVVRRWRRGCRQLARSMDRVMRDYILSVTGTRPWR
jgi:hypothetical protein